MFLFRSRIAVPRVALVTLRPDGDIHEILLLFQQVGQPDVLIIGGERKKTTGLRLQGRQQWQLQENF